MPTRDKDERPADGQLPAGEAAPDRAISEHRRKIIKASAAVVPAIMTIRSGAAAAMTSINLCEVKDAARANLLPESKRVLGDSVDESALDEWTRIKGKQVSHGNTTYYCAQNMSGAWECYDKDGNPPPGIPLTNPSANAAANTSANASGSLPGNSLTEAKIDAGKDVYLMAYVDTTAGGYTWYPQKIMVVRDQAASPLTGSCLCSVNPDMCDIF